MMKKGLMLAVFALISLIYAGETPQKIPVGSGVDKALVYDFNEAVKMTPYPAQAAKSFSLDCPSYSPESGKALKIENRNAQSTTGYNYYYLTEKTPGVLKINFMHKTDSEKAKLTLAFNQKGKGNGSAGNTTINIPKSETWQKFESIVDVPGETATIQFAFVIDGANATMLLDDLAFNYTADSVKIPFISQVKWAASPDDPSWNPQSSLSGFYANGKAAKVPTTMQIATDAAGLYVYFRNTEPDMANLVAKHTGDRNDEAWTDDCNTLLVFDPSRQTGWQFTVNSNGARYDAELRQKIAGDPWNAFPEWQGEWQVKTDKSKDSWSSKVFIPWKTLGVNFTDGFELKINPAREQKSQRENSTFNCYSGGFREVNKFATLRRTGNQVEIERYRNVEKISYTVKRTSPKFAEVLQKGVAGNYNVDVWAQGYVISNFPETLQKKFTEADFERWQNALMQAFGESHTGGPAYPWVINNLYGRIKEIKELNQKYQMKFPYSIHSSSVSAEARKNGAVFYNPQAVNYVDPTDLKLREALNSSIGNIARNSNYELIKDTTKFVMGFDEPTNSIEASFSRKINIKAAKEIDALSDKVKTEYGFGKYGIPDAYMAADSDTPFKRIAFYRRWNAEMKESLSQWQKAVNKVFPNVPFKLTTNNNTSGCSMLDLSNLNGLAQLIACDPYPTSTTALFNNDRALYHVGFSTKVLNDLVPGARTMVMPQCFIYHGGAPSKADMREWASQALKNGATWLMWYCAQATSEIFTEYVAMLNLNKTIAEMDKLVEFPPAKTAILYSQYDIWANNNEASHELYSVYAILGEHLKSSFRFVSDTGINNGTHDLNDFKLVYIPKMPYTDPALSGTIARWVENGGTLVVFDPEFMSFNIDGSKSDYRKKLLGDNEENNFGKGRVIHFSKQPFENSALAVRPEKWLVFFRAQALSAGEAVDLPRWDFTIPEVKETIKLEQIIK